MARRGHLSIAFDREAFDRTLSTLRRRLLEARAPAGHWQGELAGSALSTATAVWALGAVDRARFDRHIRRGLDWLAENQNPDGGWGDTVLSDSNISTTLLVWSAFQTQPGAAGRQRALSAGELWIARRAGGTDPDRLVAALNHRYGADRSFSVPILAMSALGGKLGPPPRAWRWVRALPFELAACPHRWLKRLRLPVVSYALPALIAVGQLRHHFRPPANPLVRWLRDLLRGRTLALLGDIQPPGGGFLQAAPLTSFVVMSLVAMNLTNHPVVARGVEFLVRSVRPDGSWPIDTNLGTWVTTLSVAALSAGGELSARLSPPERGRVLDWLLDQQTRKVHPYTRADPGGWAWTDLPGGVPDADDTAGALLALRSLGAEGPRVRRAGGAGVRWLLGLQNRDGGMPTFCRGWGALPFDRSGADLSAHALAAVAAWSADLPPRLALRARRAMRSCARYLARVQRADGAWVPLWFGNQAAPGEQNPAFGTARVLSALRQATGPALPGLSRMVARGAGWLVQAQGADGGWGGAAGVPPSIEETALAVDALAGLPGGSNAPAGPAGPERLRSAVSRGVSWLIERTDLGRETPPAPIGLYFAKLWYFERLYPLIFAVSALERAGAARAAGPTVPPTAGVLE